MAFFTLYKPGQGYWTRVISAAAAGAMVIWGIYWITSQLRLGLSNKGSAMYITTAVAVGLLAVLGALLWWVLNHPRIVDFMIATEAEMRKVNWPTWREIIGSTWVVICGTIMLAVMIQVVDLVFGWFFIQIGILPG